MYVQVKENVSRPEYLALSASYFRRKQRFFPEPWVNIASLYLRIATRKDFIFAVGGVISKSATKLRDFRGILIKLLKWQGFGKSLVLASTTILELKFSN